jgi:hypothetical protein
MFELIDLPFDRTADPGMTMTQDRNPPRSDCIKVPLAVSVKEVDAIAPADDPRRKIDKIL